MPDPRFLKENCYIGGDWVGAEGGETIAVKNPATGEVLGTVPRFGRAQTRAAIEAAQAAFLDWRALSAATRAGYCLNIHDALMDHQAALGERLTLEMGKPLAEAKGEIAYATSFFKWFAEEAPRVYGDTRSGWIMSLLSILRDATLLRMKGAN